MNEKIPIGILISGRGSNMSALLDACKQEDFPCTPAIVASNRPNAPGLEIARQAGVPTCVIDHTRYESRESFEEALDKTLREAGARLLCNAGFMRILTAGFTERWRDRQLNIHPSLLPDFPGIRVHERVLESGVTVTGCTVHYVRAEVDAGPIIEQAQTPVAPDDTPDTLAAKVLRLEHQLYPRALRAAVERLLGEHAA